MAFHRRSRSAGATFVTYTGTGWPSTSTVKSFESSSSAGAGQNWIDPAHAQSAPNCSQPNKAKSKQLRILPKLTKRRTGSSLRPNRLFPDTAPGVALAGTAPKNGHCEAGECFEECR